MKVTLLTAVNSRSAGGLFYSVKYLAKYLRKIPVDTSITSHNDKFSEEDRHTYEDTPLNIYTVSDKPLLKKLCYSPDLDDVLNDLSPDIIHQQGIWLYHSKANKNYQKKNKQAKSIIAPRGMLDPWLRKNSPFIKKIVSLWYESANLKAADCFHALCLSEMESMRKFGITQPIAVIPNGIEPTDWKRENTLAGRQKTMLYLGRLDPKKGVDIFLNALAAVYKTDAGLLQSWKFIIGGWGNEAYIAQLKEIVKANALEHIIEFTGSKYGQDKINLLKQSDAFILPSHSEGLPMAILEAWAYTLPVVMTEYCNIPEGFEHNAAFEISTEQQKQEQQLKAFFKLSDDQIFRMGEDGHKLVEEKFSWEKIAAQTNELYKWLKNGGSKPKFVHNK